MKGLGGITGMRKYYRVSYKIGKYYGVHYLIAKSKAEARKIGEIEIRLEFPAYRNIQILGVAEVSSNEFPKRVLDLTRAYKVKRR